MAYKASNNAISQLASSMGGTSGDTTLVIEAGDIAKFPVINNGGAGSDYTLLTLVDGALNTEIVKVTRHDTNAASFTVVRGEEGTTIRPWQIGDAVSCQLTAGVVTQTYTHPSEATGAHAASAIAFTPAGNLSAPNVQAALQELDSEKSGTGHGHTAGQTSFTPAGTVSAGNVQAAIEEVSGDVAALGSSFASHSHSAAGTAFTPTGTLSASNVQGAIAELESDFVAHVAAPTVPVGTTIYTSGNSAPTGYLKENGALLSRTTYSNLWAFAQTSGNLAASDGVWTEGQFSPGDGSTTFRIPDGRGNFYRAWDDGRGVDSGRAIGSSQSAANASHTHKIFNADVSPGGSGAYATLQLINGANTANYAIQGSANTPVNYDTSTQGTEARPRNIAKLACIKY